MKVFDHRNLKLYDSYLKQIAQTLLASYLNLQFFSYD